MSTWDSKVSCACRGHGGDVAPRECRVVQKLKPRTLSRGEDPFCEESVISCLSIGVCSEVLCPIGYDAV